MKKLPLLVLFIGITTHVIAQTDTLIGLGAGHSNNYKQLTQSVNINASTDRQKANAIYNWITHNVGLDIKKMKDPMRDPEKAEEVLHALKTTPDGYAVLFAEMCKEAGLLAVKISGYSKAWFYDDNDKQYLPRHAWNAVLIDNKWELVDACMGAGGVEMYESWLRKQMHMFSKKKLRYGNKERFKFHYHPEYFAQAPLVFRREHLPADPLWQLTETPMPLSVYEAGDSTVIAYNATHNDVRQDNAALKTIALLSEEDLVLDMADRAYEYNGRFETILGVKEHIEAGKVVDRYNEQCSKSGKYSIEALREAKEKLLQSKAHMQDQKKGFPDHYSGMEKKNGVKNREAKDYFRQLKTDDKLLQAQCERYKKNTGKHNETTKEKYKTVMERKHGLYAEKIEKIPTAKVEKPAGDYMLKKLVDSVDMRNGRISELNESIKNQQAQVQAGLNDANAQLQHIAWALGTADTLIYKEAANRIDLKDNYDREVRIYSNKYKALKFGEIDTMQKYYMLKYDSVNKMQDEMMKTYVQVMDQYKNNIRDAEQYKKMNSTDPVITGNYGKMVMEYTYCIDRYADMANARMQIEQDHDKLFGRLASVYKRELKLLEDMDIAEKTRKKLETKDISNNRSFDTRENEKNQKLIDKSLKEVDNSIQQLSGV